MNINCALKCKHQAEGKCALTEACSLSSSFIEDSQVDCLYFEDVSDPSADKMGSRYRF